ncbi:MAG: hypothetical protein HY922_02985 [Elusimicrobia bacterium]|nr:hypothetical protein [Elusimicrobiota bacterium]
MGRRSFALPSFLYLIIAASTLAIAFPASAGSGKPNTKVKAMFYGEGGQTYPNTPDETDFQNSSPVPQKPSVLPPANTPAAVPGPAQPQNGAVEAVVVQPPAVNPGIRRVWPGARRPSPRAPAGEPSAARSDPGPDGLKDAPNAMRYSLWAGLNAPMMLPASKVGQITADQAKAMGRTDYETHILGAEAESGRLVEDAAAKGTISGPALAGGMVEPAEVAPEGLFVTLDLDISATPGEYRDAAADISGRSGLKLDDRFPPVFGDSIKTRVSLRGWVAPSQLGRIFGPNVQRLRVERSQRILSAPDLPRTELLVGVRIPQGVSPSAALASALERLSRQSDFRIKRVIGYQAIPGTSQMVIVVAGRVPVSNISRVLGDPHVVKIVPSPDSTPANPGKEAVRPFLSRSFFAYAASKEPRLLLGTLLLTFVLAGSLVSRSRKR